MHLEDQKIKNYQNISLKDFAFSDKLCSEQA